jgi:hypothetical protein
VPTLADEISDNPVLLALLNPLELRRQQLTASEPAADEHGDHGVVPECA